MANFSSHIVLIEGDSVVLPKAATLTGIAWFGDAPRLTTDMGTSSNYDLLDGNSGANSGFNGFMSCKTKLPASTEIKASFGNFVLTFG